MSTVENKLRQDLRGWQIFFIVYSTIIGEGIFSRDGAALKTSGPGGTLLAIFIVGTVAICVMEGVSEFVQLYPCPNAIVAYIEAFVDEDLALVCGMAYWYTWASLFAGLNLTAANQTGYWGLNEYWQVAGFYLLTPLVLLGINLVGVGLFGWIESVGGFLKVLLVVGTGLLMYILSGKKGDKNPPPLYDGFRGHETIGYNRAAAVCWNLPVIAYSFLGSESVAVTAFEAKYSRSLRIPSRTVAYVITLLYLFTATSEFLLIGWEDPRLAQNEWGRPVLQGGSKEGPNTNNMPVIAAFMAGLKELAGFLNGCYIFSALSASNSALYIASRTLYGLTRELSHHHFITRNLNKLSRVVPKTSVPAIALLVSVLAFFWLPFLHLNRSPSMSAVINILQTTGAESCLLVWAALSLAFIRYYLWLKANRGALEADEYIRFHRNRPKYGSYTFLGFSQPLPAYVGLCGSLVIVFVFTTSTWWYDNNNIVEKVLTAYAAPFVLILMWLALKVFRKLYYPNDFHWWVTIGDDFMELHRRLMHLEWRKDADKDADEHAEQELEVRELPSLPEQDIEPPPHCCRCGNADFSTNDHCSRCQHLLCPFCESDQVGRTDQNVRSYQSAQVEQDSQSEETR